MHSHRNLLTNSRWGLAQTVFGVFSLGLLAHGDEICPTQLLGYYSGVFYYNATNCTQQQYCTFNSPTFYSTPLNCGSGSCYDSGSGLVRAKSGPLEAQPEGVGHYVSRGLAKSGTPFRASSETFPRFVNAMKLRLLKPMEPNNPTVQHVGTIPVVDVIGGLAVVRSSKPHQLETGEIVQLSTISKQLDGYWGVHKLDANSFQLKVIREKGGVRPSDFFTGELCKASTVVRPERGNWQRIVPIQICTLRFAVEAKSSSTRVVNCINFANEVRPASLEKLKAIQDFAGKVTQDTRYQLELTPISEVPCESIHAILANVNAIDLDVAE